MALFSGPGGLDLIAELVAGAPAHVHPGSLLALEVGAEQGGRVARLIEATGRFGDPRIVPDLTGRDRIVLAEAG
jgi:release factor glutamine methyltransferase